MQNKGYTNLGSDAGVKDSIFLCRREQFKAKSDFKRPYWG